MGSTAILMLFPSCLGVDFQFTGVSYYQSGISLSGVFLNMMESSHSKSMAQDADSGQSWTYLCGFVKTPLLTQSF